MELVAKTWEAALTKRALEALNSTVLSFERAEPTSLEKAYAHCADVTKEHSKTFYLATQLLPEEKRQAAHALYAFCRHTDDIVDEIDDLELKTKLLKKWRADSRSPQPDVTQPILYAWADAQTEWQIPHGYIQQLIDGISMDIHVNRYETFDELATYCYGVASTVGLMVMHLVGFKEPEALYYAIKLGVALQLTNILRDVKEDWDNDRVYLPADELAHFGLDEDFIGRGQVDEKWREFMRFQIARARKLYADAKVGISMLEKEGRFAIGASASLYEAILKDIENHDYDVFSRRAYVPKWKKFSMLPGIWWEAR